MTTMLRPTTFPNRITAATGRTTGHGTALLAKMAAGRLAKIAAQPSRAQRVSANGSLPRPAPTKAVSAAVKPSSTPGPVALSRSVALAEIPGVGQLRPGEVERLGAHGITLGLRNGLLSIERAYAPAVANILAQGRSAG